MPPASGVFAPNSKGGQYTLINEDFGDVGKVTVTGPGIGKVPTVPGVPGTGIISTGGSTGLAASLSIPGGNDRFLIGSSLPIAGSVTNNGGSTATALNWHLASETTGVSITPTSASGVAKEVIAHPLSGSINSSSLSAWHSDLQHNGFWKRQALKRNGLGYDPIPCKAARSTPFRALQRLPTRPASTLISVAP